MKHKLKRCFRKLSYITLDINCDTHIYTDVARFTISILDLQKVHCVYGSIGKAYQIKRVKMQEKLYSSELAWDGCLFDR